MKGSAAGQGMDSLVLSTVLGTLDTTYKDVSAGADMILKLVAPAALYLYSLNSGPQTRLTQYCFPKWGRQGPGRGGGRAKPGYARAPEPYSKRDVYPQVRILAYGG
jgi:hypothetical protein